MTYSYLLRWFLIPFALLWIKSECTAQTLYRAQSATMEHYKASSVLLQDGRVLIVGGSTSSSPSGSTNCEIYDPTTNRYVITGAMSTPRAWHSTVLLNNGKVLVIGGYTGQTLASCELYDPGTGIWSKTGSLSTSRSRTSATLLLNGKVLVAGGYSSQGGGVITTTSCEIYDPQSGLWSQTSPLKEGRSSHASVMLNSGEVLVVSGYPYYPSCEIYNPGAQQWRQTNPIQGLGIGEHSLTKLADGRVLMAGGWAGNGGMLSRCEIYDPNSGLWRLTASMATPRASHRAILLPNGKVFIIAGHNATTAGVDNTCYSVSSTEIFDPVLERWTAGPALPVEMSYFTATLLPSGFVWIGVGGKRDVNKDPALFHRESFIVDFTSGSFSSASSNTIGHSDPSGTLLVDGRVLLAGGGTDCTNNLPNATTELYDYRAGVWSSVAVDSLPTDGQTATLLADGSVIVVGGHLHNTPISRTSFFQATSNRWLTGPELNLPRYGHTATLLMDGSLLVIGGTTTSGTTATAELFDLKTQTWSFAAPLPVPIRGHTASLLPDGHVFVAGGDNTGKALKSCFVYDPSCDSWSATGDLQRSRADHTATLLEDGTVLIAGGDGTGGSCEVYDPKISSTTLVGAMQIPRSNHTATLLPNGNVAVIGGNDALDQPINSAETYNPTGRNWRSSGLMLQARTKHTAILLPNGKVLVAGGITMLGSGCKAPTEDYLFDPGNGYRDVERSVISAISPTSLTLSGTGNAILTLRGNGFRDDNNRNGSEGSTGDYNSTPVNYPVIRIQRIGGDRYGNDFASYLPFDIGNTLWSSTGTQVRLPLGTSDHRVFPSGYYSLSVIANGIPSISSFFQITYSDAPQQGTFISPPSITCGSYAFDISSPCSVKSLTLDSAASSNLMLITDPPLPATTTHVILQLIDPMSNGTFLLKVNDGRVVKGIVPASARFDIVGLTTSSTISLAEGCDSILIHNRSSSNPLVLDAIYLRHNIEFSIPPSQLPLIIAPNTSRYLEICRAPSTMPISNDSLIIAGGCSNVVLPLVSVVDTSLWRGEGQNCQATLSFRQLAQYKGTLIFGSAIVNREASLISLQIDRFARDGAELPLVTCRLYDLLGKPIHDGQFRNELHEVVGRYTIEHSIIEIDVHAAPSGNYIIVIETSDGVRGYPVAISH